MYVDISKSQGKYTRYLLRESYRENGKVKHRTIANISQCSEEEIEAIRLALKHKKDLAALASLDNDISLGQGLSVGVVWLVYAMARQLGITDALGSSRQGKLALWQVIARIINQGSRLSSVRLAGGHAGCDILGLKSFDEDDLYKNLDWLCEKQTVIENRLFKTMHPGEQPGLFLYDVTSSYLEGTQNDIAAFGYNRDTKKGIRQIIIALLSNEDGKPLSIEVFTGNTQNPKTPASRIHKVAKRFGGSEVTFVGDRGMIKTHQVEGLFEHGFHYITAITKPQIESLLAKGVIQMELFDQELAEAVSDDGVRYVLRRNPVRAQEIRKSRQSKLASLTREVKNQNEYLAEHSGAHVEVALRRIDERCKKLSLSKWVTPSASGRNIILTIDKEAQQEEAKLDGCYVLKTDLTKDIMNKKTMHARYKDLALVEWAFRTSKTVESEMCPVYVRLADRKRGHAFIVLLAYRIVQELAERWHNIELTVEEGLKELTTLCATEVIVSGRPYCNKIPEPRSMVRKLLEAANVRLPDALPCSGIRVATRKKLANQ